MVKPEAGQCRTWHWSMSLGATLLCITAAQPAAYAQGVAVFDAFDVSLFVDNVTNSAPDLELTSSPFYDPQDWQNVTLQPRTFGLTMTWRR